MQQTAVAEIIISRQGFPLAIIQNSNYLDGKIWYGVANFLRIATPFKKTALNFFGAVLVFMDKDSLLLNDYLFTCALHSLYDRYDIHASVQFIY